MNWKPYHNKNMSRINHSVFGDFPKENMVRRQMCATMVGPFKTDKEIFEQKFSNLRKYDTGSPATSPILKKGKGLGGKNFSLNTASPKKSPMKPIAGAVFERTIPLSEFRLFYDRGDLPVTVCHGQ